jgi:alpha-1,6-mannosyltransferase
LNERTRLQCETSHPHPGPLTSRERELRLAVERGALCFGARSLRRSTPAAIIFVFCILASIQSGQRHPDASLFTLIYVAAGLAWMAAVWLETRWSGAFPLWWIIAIGLACRLVLLPSGPLFDNDVFRYLWDGRVAAAGVNPFAYAPASDHLAWLRTGYFSQIGYPDIGTIYPPFAQMLFLCAAEVHLATPALFKLALIPFDLGTAALVVKLLRRIGKPQTLVLVYLWSPLILKEVYNSAHIDIVMAFFVMLSIYLAVIKKPILAGIGGAFSVMAKGASTALLPLIAGRRWLAFSSAAVVTCAAVSLPYLAAGRSIFGGASAYAHYWRFNDGAYHLLQSILPTPYAKLAAGLILLAYLLYCARNNDSSADGILIACRNVTMAMLLLMPVVDPWYLCLLVPFLCFGSSLGMLLFCALCPLSYFYYAHNTFPTWLRVAEYGPVYLALVYPFTANYRKGVKTCPEQL